MQPREQNIAAGGQNSARFVEIAGVPWVGNVVVAAACGQQVGDFEDFFTNRQEFEFWSDSDKFIFNIYDEHKFTVEPDKNERMFDAAIRQIISYFQEKNNTLSDIHNTNEDIKSNELSTNELSDLHKSLEDLQREAIAEEMSNLL